MTESRSCEFGTRCRRPAAAGLILAVGAVLAGETAGIAMVAVLRCDERLLRDGLCAGAGSVDTGAAAAIGGGLPDA